ncbi:hypothetical protein [Chroococcidiopsis sp. CCMEE 29]|uniref:hypothetical protein n=1 Tax=Chroococcidiopsis sp. CCMEE 29 TaxID=155894 RepID=UPI00202079A3|nr:hypothetical protein [Chroococcidiopsis sp. CCMEE 29]
MPMVIARHLEREAYLKAQRAEKLMSSTPDMIIVLFAGQLMLMDYAAVVTSPDVKVVRHPLNYPHLFSAEQLVDVELPTVPKGLSLNESFNHSYFSA